jgi:hypothetical protein
VIFGVRRTQEGRFLMSNGKRKLKAAPFIRDLRDGVGDEQLMEKYSLSPSQLEKAFRKLVDAGAIAEMELFMRSSISDSTVTKAFIESQRAISELDAPEEALPPHPLEAPSEVEITEHVITSPQVFGGIFTKLTGRG